MILLTMMKGKLHQATVTTTELHYEGSIAIDESLLEAANILKHEQVDIYNITNGERFTTYAILAPRGSGMVSIRGAGARKAQAGDKIIIAAYAQMTEGEAKKHLPSTVILEANNQLPKAQ